MCTNSALVNRLAQVQSTSRGIRHPMQASALVTAETSLPLVSVIVGNYNQSAFVADTLRSVAAQTYSNFECVVVDDASDDESSETISDCLSELCDSRFRYLQREQNGGQTASMMSGFRETSGQLVAFVDADDLWLPAFLERHVAAHLCRVESAAVSTSDTGLIDSNGALIAGGNPLFRGSDMASARPHVFVSASEKDGEDTFEFIAPGLAHWLWSQTSAMVFRRSVLARIWPQDPGNIRICSDEYLANLAHMIGGTVRIDRALGHYRLHGANSYTSTEFTGDFSTMDFRKVEISAGIRSETVKTLCALARDPDNRITKRYLSRALVNYMGWLEAIRLSREDPQVRDLVSEYLTPRRRAIARLARCLPKGMRPRKVRPFHQR